MTDDNLLGAFLRNRRERTDPAAAGIVETGRRQVSGLRREELSMLAGISAPYYVRLEQGRDRNPSAQVLDALARVLGLDAIERAHLEHLARPVDPAPETVDAAAATAVRPGIRHLLGRWDDLPAFVVNARRDVLAATELAGRVNPAWTPGMNVVRFTFEDARARALYVDWDEIAAQAVAGLRSSLGTAGAEGVTELVRTLTARSPAFRELWERQDVIRRTIGDKRFALGGDDTRRLTLNYEALAVDGAPGQTLFVYFPEPGSDDELALAQLARGPRPQA